MAEIETVEVLCRYIGWGTTDLMREARISYPTAEKAIRRTGPLSRAVKRDICSALSRALNQTLQVGDIQW